MSEPRDPTYVPFSETSRKSAQARAGRQRLPLVWLVVAGTIAIVFAIGFVLAFAL
jgi:hypothetical protein